MIIKNGCKYDSNYARASAYFLSTCAPCPKDKNRKQAYELITSIYNVIMTDPVSVGLKPVPDVAFQPWEHQKGHEKEVKYIRSAVAKVEALIAEFYTIVINSEVTDKFAYISEDFKISRTLAKILNHVGVEIIQQEDRIRLSALDGCFKGLKELAEISKKSEKPINDRTKKDKENKAYLYFSRCVFEPESNWSVAAFDQLLDADGRLIWLCSELEHRGYRRIECFDGEHISLDYVKQHGKKEEPLKLAWGEKTHSGISLTFEEIRLEPCFLWIRVPMFKTILENAEHMPANVVEFITNSTKTCDGCGYCVQMDKTGKRPLSHVKYGEVNKCPYYPGFSMNWRFLTQELADNILCFLDEADHLLDYK